MTWRCISLPRRARVRVHPEFEKVARRLKIGRICAFGELGVNG
jgi:hypothetical protein